MLVSPSILTRGRWLVHTVLLARIITDILAVFNFKRLFLYTNMLQLEVGYWCL